MLDIDMTILNYNQHIYANDKKSENWVLYFRKLLDNSLSQRFLFNCDEINNNDNCPISLEKINNPVKTSCGHIFEKENIILWIKEKRTCPMCQKKLDLD
jgi:hypothetical protein